MQIRDRAHYERVCKEKGMVPLEQAEEMAAKGRESRTKNYKISDESRAIIEAAKNSKDSKGNIKLGDRAIKALIDRKAIGKTIPDYMKLPSAYQPKGGFL